MPKPVMSWRGPCTRHCARATQLLSKKCRNGGEPLATLCTFWPVRGLNLRPPVPEKNVLPLDQMPGSFDNIIAKYSASVLMDMIKQYEQYNKKAAELFDAKKLESFWSPSENSGQQ